MENRAERGGYIWTGIDSLFRRKLERRRARGRAELYGGENQIRARYRGGQRFERFFF